MSYPQNAGKIRWMTGGSNLDKEIEHIPSSTICEIPSGACGLTVNGGCSRPKEERSCGPCMSDRST